MDTEKTLQIAEPDGFYRDLGQRVRKARDQAGVTQEQLAAGVKLNRTSVTNIEKGRQRILVHTLIDIATVLRVKPELLMPRPSDEEEELALLEPEARRWIEEAVATSDAGRES